MAPEVLCYGPVQVDENTELSTLPTSSPKTDVWSIACLLLEVFSVRSFLFLFYPQKNFSQRMTKTYIVRPAKTQISLRVADRC